MPPKAAVAAATRQARVNRRAQLGPLLHLRVKSSTVTKYHAAVQAFLVWLHGRGVAVANSIAGVDEQVAEYLEFLWETGAERHDAGSTLSGIQFVLRRRRRLPLGWELLRVWQRVEPARRAPPLPEELLTDMCGLATAWDLLDVCLSLLVGYSAFLRTMETLTLSTS